jgi:phage shock protein PspC (stress-responsive transcriptional regulator)
MDSRDRKLHLSKKDSWIAGVCGGLGEKFGIDSDILRIITVVLFLCPYFPAGLIYLILWFCMPSEDKN